MEEIAVDEPSVIISRRPCVLLKYVKPKKPLTVNKDKCKSCKKCMSFGCPAISKGEKGIVIDTAQCVGCEVCVQVCPFKCIQKEGV